jgi:hypothetical protein
LIAWAYFAVAAFGYGADCIIAAQKLQLRNCSSESAQKVPKAFGCVCITVTVAVAVLYVRVGGMQAGGNAIGAGMGVSQGGFALLK